MTLVEMASGLVAALLAEWAYARRDLVRRHLQPFDVKRADVAEEWSPEAIGDADRDPKAPRLLVEPLVDVGVAGEEHREGEGERPFVEALSPTPKMQATPTIHAQADVHGQVLVRTEIVDDATPLLAVDHVGVKLAVPVR